MVGPLACESVLDLRHSPEADSAVSASLPSSPTPLALNEVMDELLEWAKTLAFTTELPLPSPIMVDETADGFRVAVCTLLMGKSGRPEMAGELCFSATVDEEGCWLFNVTRRSPIAAAGQQLPGEKRLLRAVETELRSALAARRGGEAAPVMVLPPFLDFLSPFLLPLTSLGLLGDAGGDGGYAGYRIRRSCRLDERAATLQRAGLIDPPS
jgi:hypothetical protein